MNTKPLRSRYEDLQQQIHEHNYRYHVLDAPVISDLEFDRLLNELKQIEADHPDWITPDSPTLRAGAKPASRFVKVQHPAPILSLGNAFGADDARGWFERVSRIDDRVERARFVVEPKIDGLSVVLHYHDGVFVQGATRGNGEIGEDITANLRTVKSIPLRIPVDEKGPKPPNVLVVRGEAYMPVEEFEKLNQKLQEEGKRTYLNPRNTAAGSLRQLDPALTASRPLTLLVYQIIQHERGKVPTSQWEVLEYLKALGFPVTDIARRFEDFEEALAYTERWDQKRDELSYEADGMVLKIDDLNLAKDLGFVGKDPRGAIAFKFPAREVTTTLQDIKINVGRTGMLIPNAVLEPVEIGGVVVVRATLHNFDYITEKDIRIGDRVLVKRAGEVIPYVIGPVLDARTGKEKKYKLPATCPSCGQPIERLEDEVAFYCVNAACPAQLVRNVEHFVSRGAMDIVGMGTRIVEKLIETGKVKDVADIYYLKRADILEAVTKKDRKTEKEPPGKIAENLLASIDASKSRSLARLVAALGIRGAGEVSATDLASHFTDLDALSKASAETLQEIAGIGPSVAESVAEWFSRPVNKNVIKKLKAAGVWPQGGAPANARQRASNTFDGKTFVITGTLPTWSRDNAKEFIESHGGKVTDSVSKKTSYLVLGEAPGSKYEKAKSLGVKMIGEEELKKLVG